MTGESKPLPDTVQELQEICTFLKQSGGNIIHSTAPAMPPAESI